MSKSRAKHEFIGNHSVLLVYIHSVNLGVIKSGSDFLFFPDSFPLKVVNCFLLFRVHWVYWVHWVY